MRPPGVANHLARIHVAGTRTRGDGQLGQVVTDITAALTTGKTVGEGQIGRRGAPHYELTQVDDGQGLRATPAHKTPPAPAAPMSGRHWWVRTTPGSSSGIPPKNAVTWSLVRMCTC